MPTIATLTMNPAVDLSASTARVEPVHKLRCSQARRDPGGGGVNVARVAHRLGARAIALFPAGGLVGQQLRNLLTEEALEMRATAIAGETREDFTVLDESSGEQFRFVLPGPTLRGREWMDCLSSLAHLDVKPDVVCASGSLPPGAPEDFYARVAEIASSLGACFVLDASGPPLKAALDAHIDLIKPNARELRELAGQALEDDAALIAACRALIEHRRVGAVALTLGAEGALLVTAAEAWRAAALPVRSVSSVGAGDSFLGAMTWALAAGETLQAAFRYGMAGGAAALLSPGTELAHATDILRLVSSVEIVALSGPSRGAERQDAPGQRDPAQPRER